MKKLYSNKGVILTLVLPGVLVFLFAVLAPICLSVYYGFTDYSGMGEVRLIGLENYKNLLHDKAFGRSLLNSLLLAIGFICIQHPLALYGLFFLYRRYQSGTPRGYLQACSAGKRTIALAESRKISI